MKKIIVPIVLLLITIYSCNYNGDYLTDGGLSNPETGTSTMDFLRSNSQLDSLALLIDRAGLADVVNGTTTLFAPNNVSVQRYVDKELAKLRLLDPSAEYSVESIPTDTIKKYIGMYIFEGKITRENMGEKQGNVYTSIAVEGNDSFERRISLEPADEYENQLGYYPKYVHYTSKVGENWDSWDAVYGNKTDETPVAEKDVNTIVRTSNIKTNNGVVHVLQGEYVLFEQ
ncbi:hypothetical protein [Tenacibaculum sp. UWU-22]|uniref:hypothetical protein n=1 Tax=Tenacibaculum sp. UWU-22 TaxID=3234187 RepID=UPI0034DB1200